MKSFLLPHQTNHQVKQKSSSENPPPLQIEILSAIYKISINKISGTSFVEGYFAVSISQLLEKKIITNAKTPQHSHSFRLSTTEITPKVNLPLQVEEIVLHDTEQCQQNTDFIRNLLDDIISNAS